MEKITVRQAKKLLESFMNERGLPFTKLTGRTVSFQDLARGSGIFITVHGWIRSPEWSKVKEFAKDNGFFVG